MKDKIQKLIETSKWLTLYLGLALFLFMLFDYFEIFTFFYSSASASLFMSWIAFSFLRYKEAPLKYILNVDFYTISKSTIFILLPIVFCLSILLIAYISGAYISKNDYFALDSYFLNMSVLIFILSLFEEIVFRGFLLQFLSQQYNSKYVIVISSIAFSLAHLYNPEITVLAFINIFLAGVFLSILFLKTQNVLIPTLFHFVWNIGQQLILNSAISGNDIGMNYINIDLGVNNILDDSCIISKFGIESSVFTTAFLLIIIYNISRINQSPYLSSLNFRRMYKIKQ